MIDDHSFDDAIASPEEFEVALGCLLLAATRNGIDPRGGWVYQTDDAAGTNWEAVIVELEEDEPPE